MSISLFLKYSFAEMEISKINIFNAMRVESILKIIYSKYLIVKGSTVQLCPARYTLHDPNVRF